MEVKAPGVVKLLGEHAVVYGKLALAVAISMYAKVSTKETNGENIQIKLLNMRNSSYSFNETELRQLFKSFKSRSSIKDYIKQNSSIDEIVLPYAAIASRLVWEYGPNPSGLNVSIESEIPLQKGVASSAACSVAFTVAMLNAYKISIDDKTVIDVARDGDRVIHQSEGAGAIDVSTSYYGGYVSYSGSRGANKENIDTQMQLLLVDAGPKKSTAAMVEHVAELYRADKAHTEQLLNEMEKCSIEGIRALKANDMGKLGSYMFAAHSILSQLGVSSNGLDDFVAFARKNGFYGAKLSGGGGGGVAIGLCKDAVKMRALASKSGFKADTITTSLDGARGFYINKAH